MKLTVLERPYHLCFDTLANDLRVKIIENLTKEPLSVQELAKRVNAERSNVSHSLKMLKECSYVQSEKHGKENVYFLVPRVLEELNSGKSSGEGLFRFMDSHIEKFCHNECKKIRC